MPLLFVCVVLFFSLAQLYQWSNGLTLPFPILLLAGAGLAIASNLKPRNLSGQTAAAPSASVPASQTTNPPTLPPDIRPPVEPRSIAEPQLPKFASPIEPVQSISFKLNQTEAGKREQAIEP